MTGFLPIRISQETLCLCQALVGFRIHPFSGPTLSRCREKPQPRVGLVRMCLGYPSSLLNHCSWRRSLVKEVLLNLEVDVPQFTFT